MTPTLKEVPSQYACAWKWQHDLRRCEAIVKHILRFDHPHAPLCEEHYEFAQVHRGNGMVHTAIRFRYEPNTRKQAGLDASTLESLKEVMK